MEFIKFLQILLASLQENENYKIYSCKNKLDISGARHMSFLLRYLTIMLKEYWLMFALLYDILMIILYLLLYANPISHVAHNYSMIRYALNLSLSKFHEYACYCELCLCLMSFFIAMMLTWFSLMRSMLYILFFDLTLMSCDST